MNDVYSEALKKSYANQWAKAARNCQQVHNDLRKWFRDLIFPLGHGALSKFVEEGEHEAGEVDIFVKFNYAIIAGVEVTGSANVDYSCDVWIGNHKIKYAKTKDLPIIYVLFYNNAVRIVDAKTVIRRGPEDEPRRVFGNLEHYHIVEPRFTHPYSFLKEWIQIQRTAHLRKLGYL